MAGSVGQTRGTRFWRAARFGMKTASATRRPQRSRAEVGSPPSADFRSLAEAERDGPLASTLASRLYEGGGGCQGFLGRQPRLIAGLPGAARRVKRRVEHGLPGAGVLALDAAGRVWQWVRVRGRVGRGEQRSSLYRLIVV